MFVTANDQTYNVRATGKCVRDTRYVRMYFASTGSQTTRGKEDETMRTGTTPNNIQVSCGTILCRMLARLPLLLPIPSQRAELSVPSLNEEGFVPGSWS